MKPAATPRWDAETALVAWLAAGISLLAFLYYYRQGEVLLYGDAVAHINIARRVFDSRTPGLLQLGTVWLPLPHLLMIPFLISNWMWQTGVGGSIPSMLAYALSAVGVFRLTRSVLGRSVANEAYARLGAWTAALAYALNPNLVYVQATAMTEALSLALFVWALVFFDQFLANRDELGVARRPLFKSGLCVAGAELTRYDGWFLAAALGLAVVVALWPRRKQGAALKLTASFALLVSVAPLLWLGYNAAVYRNPLEFANGPYSARAIEQRTSTPGAPPHPGTGQPAVAAAYFFKAGEMTVGEKYWQLVWVAMAIGGTMFALADLKKRAVCLLLWAPVPFYTLSVAYGGVPIFLPVWWPFSIYNLRYGLQLLPVFTVFGGVVGAKLAGCTGKPKVAAAAVLVFVGASYAMVWRAQPVCFREAWVNSRTRMALERELAKDLNTLPPDSTFLMYLGDHSGALQQAGIPLQRVIYEGNHRTWKQPSDPDGLWERALAEPERHADYVVATQGDAVDTGVNKRGLKPLIVIRVEGQAQVVILGKSDSDH